MLKTVLWDIDGTLLDFKAAERGAVPALFKRFGLGECTDKMIADYSAINERQWERLERREAPKSEILVRRFTDFFALYGIDTAIAPAFNDAYQSLLGEYAVFIPGAWETVCALKERGIPQHAVTNGTKIAQTKKLNASGLINIFDKVFISEDVGYEKPDQRYFRAVLDAIGATDTKEILIVGDSLTSDMTGGCNAGLRTCFFGSAEKAAASGLPVEFIVSSIPEVLTVVDRLLAE